jgi:hypothetical protein
VVILRQQRHTVQVAGRSSPCCRAVVPRAALINFGVDKPKLKIPTEARIGKKLFETNM